MKLTDKRNVLKRIDRARKCVQERIRANASGGRIASGLSNEGYDGGYLQALNDVEAALTHGYPSNRNADWELTDNDT